LAVIKEYYEGNTKITVCDDFCVTTDEEAKEILKKMGDIYAKYFMKRAETKKLTDSEAQ
jgi:hypothetical protein